jgi:asparagine synthase (glutamine-hydrolysing)
MSGLFTLLSPCPADVDTARRSLAVLRHDATQLLETRERPGAWIGLCGRRHEISISTQAETGRTAAVAGEIGTLTRLAAALGLPSTSSAATVALHAYDRWGETLFARLEGAFALVVHDPRRGRTLVGSDAFGIQQLFLTRLADDVLIATEAKAFVADPRFRPRADDAALACLVSLGHDFGRGLFAGVEALPQGRCWILEGDTVRVGSVWDPRPAIGGLRGRAYLDRLEETVTELAAEAFATEGCEAPALLPITGGLDSRLLAAARPKNEPAAALTFGCDRDADCRRGRQIAETAGMRHLTIPYEAGYVSEHAARTTWLTEGRLTPVENITGMQMAGLSAHRFFVSGVDCGAGRRFSKACGVAPDRRLLGADGAAVDDWLMARFSRSGMTAREATLAFGRRGQPLRDQGLSALAAYLAESRGLCGVDRIDLYAIGGRSRSWRCPGLQLASIWVTARAPFLSRRWIEAVLAGAPDERIDDLARLRLVLRIDRSVSRVPWVMTRLPLVPSAMLLGGLRGLSRLRSSPPPSADVEAPPAVAERERLRVLDARRRALVEGKRLHKHVYQSGHDVGACLRGPSRDYLSRVLCSDTCAERGLAEPAGVRRLLDEHMAGVDHSMALSLLLGIELWHRQFIDGDHGEALAPQPAEPAVAGI